MCARIHIFSVPIESPGEGSLGVSAVEPLAQGVILESWDRVPHWASCMEPASPSMSLPLSLCVSHKQINKILKKKKETWAPEWLSRLSI